MGEELELRIGGLQGSQHVVGAVLGHVVVVEPGLPQLPEVPDQHRQLALVQGKLVLPKVARLVVGVLAHLVEVGARAELAAKEPEEAFERIEDGVRGVGDDREVDGLVDEIEAVSSARQFLLAEPKEGVAERGGRVVQVVGGEDQRGRSGADPPPECLEPRAGSRRQPCEIDGDGNREPGESCREAALRVLERWSGERHIRWRAISRSEERAQSCFELRGGIAFPLWGEKERRPIRLALPAAQQPFAPVPEAEPCAVFRQRPVPGCGQQLGQIRGIGLGTLPRESKGRPRESDGKKGSVGRAHVRRSKGAFADSLRPRQEPNRSSRTRANCPRAAP